MLGKGDMKQNVAGGDSGRTRRKITEDRKRK